MFTVDLFSREFLFTLSHPINIDFPSPFSLSSLIRQCFVYITYKAMAVMATGNGRGGDNAEKLLPDPTDARIQTFFTAKTGREGHTLSFFTGVHDDIQIQTKLIDLNKQKGII